jgi:hypothetical protein
VAAAGAAADGVVAAIASTSGADDVRRALRLALAPVLPLLLELATKASRGSAPFHAAAPQVFAEIVDALEATTDHSRGGVELLAEVSRDLVMTSFGTPSNSDR